MVSNITSGRRADSCGALVLGFDAGCSTCADLAGLIERRLEGRLSVRNLRDPELSAWRAQALGENAPWAPTLFEVKGTKVRAWAGTKMSLALCRKLGPRDTWRIMRALGDAGALPETDRPPAAGNAPVETVRATTGMSRGRFLKGVGGAAAAFSVLSGSGMLASVAEAATRSPYDVVKSRKLTGAELSRVAQQVAGRVDVIKVVGSRLSTPAKVDAAEPEGFVHTLRNGSAQRVVTYNVSRSRALVHVEFTDPPRGRAPSRALLWEREGRKTVAVKASEGGRLWRVGADTRARLRSAGSRALSECPPIGNDPGPCWYKTRQCADFNWRACGQALAGVTFGTLACLSSIAGPKVGAYGTCGLAASTTLLGAAGCCARWCDVWVYDVRPGCGVGP